MDEKKLSVDRCTCWAVVIVAGSDTAAIGAPAGASSDEKGLQGTPEDVAAVAVLVTRSDGEKTALHAAVAGDDAAAPWSWRLPLRLRLLPLDRSRFIPNIIERRLLLPFVLSLSLAAAPEFKLQDEKEAVVVGVIVSSLLLAFGEFGSIALRGE